MIEAAYFIAEDSLDVSDRFTDAVNASFERLADMPGVGVQREYQNPALAGMRMWPVPGFPKHLVFYRYNELELLVLRIIHGARDIESIFSPVDDEE